MKKLFLALIVILVAIGCGTGTYSLASGKMDTGAVSVADSYKHPVVIVVDGVNYHVDAVKTKDWKAQRKIKRTAQNTIDIASGTHDVKVVSNGEEVYSRKIVISSGMHKVIEL